MRMPGMNGDEVLKHLKAQNTVAEVIILTAFADTDVPVNSFKDGAIEYLNKSVDRQELVEKIKLAAQARRIRLDQNLRLSLGLRLAYFKQFQTACGQNNRTVSNADAIYFFDELQDQIPANQDQFDSKFLASLENEVVRNNPS